MKIDWSRHAPAGFPVIEEVKAFGGGCVGASLFSLLYYVPRYADALSSLYRGNGAERTLISGAVMPDFVEILGRGLLSFQILCACMIFFAGRHYFYHFRESKSIYTMRRLPNRWELHRRCLTLPAAGLIISAAMAMLFLLAFYAVYMLKTPDVCLTPGQWQKIWSV